jgi:ATP-dependent Clp protease ATP-binding subunit ClpC
MAALSDGLTLVWSIAAGEAAGGGAAEIEPGHLLVALGVAAGLDASGVAGALPAAGPDALAAVTAECRELRGLFTAAGADPMTLRRQLRDALRRPPAARATDAVMHRDQGSRRIFDAATTAATDHAGADAVVTAPQLLLAWASRIDDAGRALLSRAGVDAAVVDRLAQLTGRPAPPRVPPLPPAAVSTTPNLDLYGRDLTALASEGKLGPVIGRREEMRAVARILAQARKGNPLLLGEPGVGKTCIVEGIAQRVVAPDPPPPLAGMRIVELSLNALVAGTQYRGQFEERMEGVIGELESSPDVVAFIDEIHTLMGAGGSEGALNAANILKPALARGALRLIGATTVTEYRNHIERDAALERRFQPVWVEEPTRAEALEVMHGLRPSLEAHHGLAIDDEALEAAVDLTTRYLRDLRLPDKAVDVVDQACAALRIQTLSVASDAPGAETVARDDVAAVVAIRARVPLEKLTEREGDRMLRLEALLGDRVKGQPDAIATVAAALRQARAGLRDPKRPRAVFLFAGATGTGKTELAKTIADVLYGSDDLVIRLDMSEYKEPHFISRLIGAPPGYKGHEVEGQLTGPIRSRPSSVVLLDEIEKAHPEILDLCLQIFDEGRLTDSRGRLASFTEAVDVCTTNLGAGATAAAPANRPPIGFRAAGGELAVSDAPDDRYAAEITAAVRAALRPELVNRIDHVVVFRPLSQEAIVGILGTLVRALEHRLESRRIHLDLTIGAREHLSAAGYDPAYGGRHLARAVETLLAQPLADRLLDGSIGDGTDVLVDVGPDGLTLTPR